MVAFLLNFGVKEYDDAVKELETQDDRSAAIVAASLLEASLVKAIKFQLKKQSAKIEGEFMKGYGPLATFRSRIDLGFFLGFYPEAGHANLLRVKDIRNRMAHQIKPHTFNTREILDQLSYIPSIETIADCWRNMEPRTPARHKDILDELTSELVSYPDTGRGKYMCYVHHRCMSLVGFYTDRASQPARDFISEHHL